MEANPNSIGADDQVRNACGSTFQRHRAPINIARNNTMVEVQCRWRALPICLERHSSEFIMEIDAVNHDPGLNSKI
jgi:hypothetical protein